MQLTLSDFVKIYSFKLLRYLLYYPIDLIKLWPFLVKELLGILFKFKLSDNRDFILNFYHTFLKLNPNEDEIIFYLKQLETYSRFKVLCSFFMLPGRIERLLFSTTGIHTHHEARLRLIQNCLPEANHILDLGGACETNSEGSLLEMGYPYLPDSIDIIDLPENERFYHPAQTEHNDCFESSKGIKIKYHYQTMSELSNFNTESIDFIWLGQSIEHIHPHEVIIILKEAMRILKPGGFFAFDTPTRALTKLLVRIGFVHPDHKIEYHPNQLIDLIKEYGFVLIDSKAISPMPFSFRSNRFQRLELIHSDTINNVLEEGFSFFCCFEKKDFNYDFVKTP